jgi:tRNA dimethylallyltransferase
MHSPIERGTWPCTGDWQTSIQRAPSGCRVITITWPREQLVERIDRRVDAMFASGLVREVLQLEASGQGLGRTARQAVGYREVLEHLAGARDLPQTVDLVKLRTRQFAKRQMTWFRSLSECRRVDGGEDPEAVAKKISHAFNS